MTAQQPMLPSVFVVKKRRAESSDVTSIEVAAERGEAYRFLPGQFSMLYAWGVGEAAISISGSPAQHKTTTYTLRSVGPVSRALANLKPGQVLGVRGPFGAAWPVDAARGMDLLLITGGVGMAPLRPAVYTALENLSNFNSVTLIYGARNPEGLLFKPELKKWGQKIKVITTVDVAGAAWSGNVGVVTKYIKRYLLHPKHTVAMICGPEIMMSFCCHELTALGTPQENIYVSMERNMKCGLAQCGRCQFGPHFVCKDGPVFRLQDIKPFLYTREF